MPLFFSFFHLLLCIHLCGIIIMIYFWVPRFLLSRLERVQYYIADLQAFYVS